MNDDELGWDWFNVPPANTDEDIRSKFQDCFCSSSGQSVLQHLRLHFLERRLGANSSDAELRHIEGARCAIAYIERLARPNPFKDRE